MSNEPVRDWEGRFVDGQFPLLQWLGASERADVFLTEVPGPPPRKAAVKLIPAEDEQAEARLRDWAVTTKLSHPSLLRVFQTGQCRINARSMVYAVTEYSDEILAQILPERPLIPAEIREMLAPLLEALGYLHERGFVHGHLKPSNLLAVNDQLKLSADSILVAGEPALALDDSHISAPDIYEAPEIAAGALTPAADIWSLGVLIVAALTQHPPAWDRATQREPVVPRSIPQPFAAIARECLQIDPERRCSLAAIKARLNSARSHPPAANSGKTLSIGQSVAAFLAVLLALGAVILLLQRFHSAESPSPLPQAQATAAAPASAEDQPAPSSAPSQPLQPPPAKPSPARPASAPQSPSIFQRPAASNSAAASGGILQQSMPDVPARARASIRGTLSLTIRVAVDAGGNVTDATLDSPNSSQYFAKLAMKAARSWKFKPAAGTWLLRFQFTQTGTTVAPIQTTP